MLCPTQPRSGSANPQASGPPAAPPCQHVAKNVLMALATRKGCRGSPIFPQKSGKMKPCVEILPASPLYTTSNTTGWAYWLAALHRSEFYWQLLAGNPMVQLTRSMAHPMRMTCHWQCAWLAISFFCVWWPGTARMKTSNIRLLRDWEWGI